METFLGVAPSLIRWRGNQCRVGWGLQVIGSFVRVSWSQGEAQRMRGQQFICSFSVSAPMEQPPCAKPVDQSRPK